MLAPYWSGHSGIYDGLFADLQRDHRVVTWDARGTGESTRSGPFDIETDCGDLEAALERVDGATALIGVANGANVAVHVAARRPELVGSVVAFGTGPFARVNFADSDAMVASESVVAAFLEMLQRDYRAALRTMLTATNPQMSEDELRERIDFQFAYCPQEVACERVRAWAEDDPTKAAAEIGERLWIFSTTSVAGAWLPPTEERRRLAQELTPQAHLEDVEEDEGPISRPDIVAGALRRITEPLRMRSPR
jgi:pimeloyl-ACP methyl ester carboxylesterase